MKDYNFRYDKDGNPLIEDCQKNSFFIYYVSSEALTLFRAFWFNNFGIADKYVAFWDKVAEKLSPNKYVIGFDPSNEPMPSWTSALNAIYTATYGHFDKADLTPIYSRIYKALQKHNQDNIMYFEPGQFPDEAPGLVFDLGF